jgi:hypothetical protein
VSNPAIVPDGRKVNLSRPRDRAPVDENLLEEIWIIQWRKNASQPAPA